MNLLPPPPVMAPPVGIPVIPENAPFSAEQRAWLNGFLAGMLSKSGAAPAPAAPPEAEEEFPWHDPALALPDRMKLAEGKPVSRRLMAAMAQLDCGSCGSNCREYAESIASGADNDITKCSPGGRDTQRKLKELVTAELKISAKPAAPAAKHSAGVAARFVSAERLTGETSAKDVRHVVIDLSGTGLTYEVGDSLSVRPANCGELVAHTLELLGAMGNEPVPTPDGYRPIAEALRSVYTITTPTDDLLELLARVTSSQEDREEIQRHLAGDGYPEGMQVADLLALYPRARPSLDEFCKALKPLQTRLYSISSSLKAHPGQVHLTVGMVKYTNIRDRLCKGVASTFLGERVDPGAEVTVAVHEAKGFRLPPDPTTPVIMIGPGTGIAPFRAFLHDRRASGATGKNWLFFGDQRRDSDFLYRDELTSFTADGFLTRLDLAFSRDQKEKIYVQNRMHENAAELYQWLEEGAHLYVCGDAKRMAKDVDDALAAIIRQQGGMTPEAASTYVAQLKTNGRYQRDVY